MKVSSLLHLVDDAADLADFFTKVDTPEQLVSRLERLKRQGADELLECLEGLRASIAELLSDTLEMSASTPDDEDDDSLDKELQQLVGELDKERELDKEQRLAGEVDAAEPKKDPPDLFDDVPDVPVSENPPEKPPE